jgi:hypothetical protein
VNAHTPGPWRVTDDGLIEAPQSPTDVGCFTSDGIPHYDDQLLIAASPRMLAALERALPYLIRLGDFTGNADGRCETILEVREAIAEATGSELCRSCCHPLGSHVGMRCEHPGRVNPCQCEGFTGKVSREALAAIIYRKHAGKGDAFNLQRPCDVCGAERGARCLELVRGSP